MNELFIKLESLPPIQGFFAMAGIIIAVVLGTLYIYWLCMYSFSKKKDLPPYIESEDDEVGYW